MKCVKPLDVFCREFGLCLVSLTIISNVRKLIKKYSGEQSESWRRNALNSIHMMFMIVVLMYNYMNEYNRIVLHYTLSSTFYLVDIGRYTKNDILFWHHLVTIGVFYVVKNSEEIAIGEKMILMIEIGNIPLSIVHAMKSHSNRKKWVPMANSRVVLYSELIWYVFFRVCVPLYILRELKHTFHVFIGLIFIVGSGAWSVQLCNTIRRTIKK